MPVDVGLINPMGLGAEAAAQRNIMPDFAGDWLKQQQLNLQRQEEARLSAKQAAGIKAAADADALKEAFFANPNGTTYARMVAADPEHQAGYAEARGAYSKTRPEYQQANSLYYKARNDPKGAGADLKTMLDARTAANGGVLPEEDQDDQDIYEGLIDDNDPQHRQWALGAMAAAAAELSGDQKSYWETHDKAFPPTDMIEKDGLFYKKTPGGIPVLTGQAKERIKTNPDGTSTVLPQLIGVPVIDLGGPTAPTIAPREESGESPAPTDPLAPLPTGTPAPVATAQTRGRARRVNGWTPRHRDGGDNPDNVVDNKIAAIQRSTGFAPDVGLTKKDMPTLFDAIVPTEGGATLQAGRNPGGIKDGAWARAQPGYIGKVGNFAKFNTVAAGRNAGVKLLMKKFDAGHRTLRDFIEGRPAGRGAASQQAARNEQAKPLIKYIGQRKFVKKDGRWFEAPG